MSFSAFSQNQSQNPLSFSLSITRGAKWEFFCSIISLMLSAEADSSSGDIFLSSLIFSAALALRPVAA